MENSGLQESVSTKNLNMRRNSRGRSNEKNQGRRKSQDKAAKKRENEADNEEKVEEMDKETFLSHCLLNFFFKLKNAIYNLQEPLQECSEQRLRALLMSFRKAANTENRITLKDLNMAFQDLSIKIPSKGLPDLVEMFTDQYGIDFERLFKFLAKIHDHCNRDSSKVRRSKNECVRETNAQVLHRMSRNFQKDPQFVANYEEFKVKINDRVEKHRSNLLAPKEITRMLDTCSIPLYGALLNSVYERTNQNNLISVSKFLSFIDEAAREEVQAQLTKQTLITRVKTETQDELIGKNITFVEPSNVVADVSSNREEVITVEEQPKLQNQNQEGKAFFTINEDDNLNEKEKNDDIKVEIQNQNDEKNNEKEHQNEPVSYKIKLNNSEEIIVPLCNYVKYSYSDDSPNLQLELDWIYGYSGSEDLKHNLTSVPFTNEIAYVAGSFVILYSFDKKRQRFYRDHLTPIRCIKLYFNGFYMLSASIKTDNVNSSIKLWRVDSLKTVKTLLKDGIKGSIVAMEPSRYTAEKLLVLEQVDMNKMNLFLLDVVKDVKLANLEIDMFKITDIGTNPKDENYIVTIGKEHLGFWKYESNKINELFEPNYERNLKAQYITSMCFKPNGDLITGDSNGNIYIWPFEDNRIYQYIKHGHEGSITSIVLLGSFMITCGRDCKIYGWTFPKLDHAGALQVPKEESGIKVILSHKEYFLVSTKKSRIFYAKKISDDPNFPLNGIVFEKDLLVDAHVKYNKLKLRINPKIDDEFATFGGDDIFCVIKSSEHRIEFKKSFSDSQITAVEFGKLNPNLFYVGTSSGCVLIIDALETDKKEIARLKIPNCKEIELIKLSPDENKIAAASTSGFIYVLSLLKEKNEPLELILNGSFKEHKSPISGIDWTTEIFNGSYHIRSSSVKKFFIWRVNDFMVIKDYSKLNPHLMWASQECLYTYENQGIMNLVHNSEDKSLRFHRQISDDIILIMDSKSQLYAYHFPTTLKSKFRKFELFGTNMDVLNITSFIYSVKHGYLLVADSLNNLIYQWKIH